MSVESEVLAAAAEGDWVDFGGRDDRSMEGAALVRVLRHVSTRALRLRGALLTGPIDLSAVPASARLDLEDCVVDEVSARDGAVAVLRMHRCEIRLVDAARLVVAGDFDLSGSTVRGYVNLAEARIGGSIVLDAVTIDGVPGSLDASRARIDGDLSCRVRDGERFTASGSVILRGARVGGSVRFTGARLDSWSAQALDGDGLRVGQDIIARATPEHRFKSRGGVRFAGARVGGSVNLNGAMLAGMHGGHALVADRAQVDQSLFCSSQGQHRFTATGTVSVMGASVKGIVNFGSAMLNGRSGPALDAGGIVVGESLFCQGTADRPFTADGEVSIVAARIGVQLGFDGAVLTNSADTADEQDAGHRSVPAETERATPSAAAITALRLHGTVADSLWLRLRVRPVGAIDLTRARFGVIHDAPFDEPPEWPELYLDGCRFEALDPWPRVSVDTRLRWLGTEPHAPQPYEQLAAAYKRAGEESAARRVSIARERRRRQTPGFGLRAALWNRFLEVTVAYGYRPSQALAILVLLWGLGSALISRGDVAPAKTNPIEFDRFLYTLDVLVPAISFGQETSWNALGATQWLTAALTVCGWLLAAALVAGVTTRRQ